MTVEHEPTEDMPETILENFPAFNIGDTVRVKVDGIEYLLVAFDDDGFPTIGDSYEEVSIGTGEYGWTVFFDEESGIIFYSLENRTVSYEVETIHKLDMKYLPDEVNGADWNANEGEIGYVKNRTHYVTTEAMSESRVFEETGSGGGSITDMEFATLLLNNYETAEYEWLDGTKLYYKPDSFTDEIATRNLCYWLLVTAEGNYRAGSPVVWVYLDSGIIEYGTYEGWGGGGTITVNTQSETVVQLDEKFIPDTIARTSDYVLRSDFEALLTRVEALENGGGSTSSPLVINVSQYGASSGTPWNLYINGEMVESFSDSTDSSDNGTFTYENVNSAFIKIPDSAMSFLGGYMSINGTMIYEHGTNHLLSTDGIYSLPTSGTVNIEYQVMD